MDKTVHLARIQLKGMLRYSVWSDTLWGQLMWACRYIEGEQALERLLEIYDSSTPLRVSGVFPYGFLPRPIFPQIPFVPSGSVSAQLEERTRAKKQKKRKYIRFETFRFLQSKSQTLTELHELLRSELEEDPSFKPFHVTRTAIDRQSGRAADRMLHNSEYWYLDGTGPEESMLWAFIETDASIDSLRLGKWLEYITHTGLGGKTSHGAGNCVVELVEMNSDLEAILKTEGNCFMSISHCAGKDLEPMAYGVDTKYGKLGIDMSRTDDETGAQFMKHPIVLYTPGSMFFSGRGEILKGVHQSRPEIKHNALSFPLYLNVSDLRRGSAS